MGTVHRARDTRDGRVVAVKILHRHLASDPTYVRRFRREAKIARSLNSPHITSVLDFGRESGNHLLVMEYVEGDSLAEVIKTKGPLPAELAVSVASQVAQALDSAHRLGIVHRDIKPQNIIVSATGHVKVTDFGIAKVAGQTALTKDDTLMGTPEYMAPDHLTGKVDVRSDIYSLGVVLYEMVTGVVPFTADTPWGVLDLQQRKTIPDIRVLRPGVPLWLIAVIERCLAKRPGRRFGSPSELLRALEERGLRSDSVTSDQSRNASASSRGQAGAQLGPVSHKRATEQRLVAIAVAGIVLVLAIVAMSLVFRDNGSGGNQREAGGASISRAAVILVLSGAVTVGGLVYWARARPSGWTVILPGGQHVALNRGASIVGRDRTSRVRIEDPSVSRRHAELRADSAGVSVRDLQSVNGTFVNGSAVSFARLSDGDSLSFGSATVTLRRALIGTRVQGSDRLG